MADGAPLSKEVREASANASNYCKQQPNKRILGVRIGMGLYCTPEASDSSKIARWFRENGDAPVLYDMNAANRTIQQLRSLMESKGCFGSTVSFDTTHVGRHNIRTRYQINATPRHRIDEVNFTAATPEIVPLLQQWRESSHLQYGDYYDQARIDLERERIASNLRSAGYYLANKNLIRFEVDTTYDSILLAINVLVDNPTIQKGNTQQEVPLQVYTLDNIYIYPNNVQPISSQRQSFDTIEVPYALSRDTTIYKFISDGKMNMRPRTICRSMFIREGRPFSPGRVASTYNSLLGLHNFKYIDIEFEESPNSNDTARRLDAKVRLMNSPKQRLSASIELSNASRFGVSDAGNDNNFFTSGNFGVEGVLGYQHKNLFHGAEQLDIEASMLVELPKLVFSNGAMGFRETFSSFDAGVNASLDIPIFLLPFTRNVVWQRTKPHTQLSIGGGYQYLSYFERVQANTSFGYTWSHSRQVRNKLNPIEFSFVRFLSLDRDYLNRIVAFGSDVRQMYRYEDHFIMNTHYEYTFSNQQLGNRKDFTYIHASAETAGNLLDAISHAIEGPINEDGYRTIFGVVYSQYFRIEGEIKHYFYIGKRNTFVTRLLAGIGVPYGNSISMPFEKSFFGGGPTSMRAWQIRRLGPGSFATSQYPSNYALSMGDISLAINLEERFPLPGIFEGAVFADIGNIWTVNDESGYPNGKISMDRFFSDLAVGVGLGLRASISILTLRLDFAVPFYDPGFSNAERWITNRWNWGCIVTNFGIDYPF